MLVEDSIGGQKLDYLLILIMLVLIEEIRLLLWVGDQFLESDYRDVGHRSNEVCPTE